MGPLEVAVIYFMTSKGHVVIRGRRDLIHDPKGHGDCCGSIDPFYDPKITRGH